MNPEFEAMVREAGLLLTSRYGDRDGYTRLIRAAQQRERDACALIARQWDVDHPGSNYGACIARLIELRKESE